MLLYKKIVAHDFRYDPRIIQIGFVFKRLNSKDSVVVLVVTATTEAFVLSWDQLFYSCLIEAPCPSCHSCFDLEIFCDRQDYGWLLV